MLTSHRRTPRDGWRGARPRWWRQCAAGVITLEEACRRYELSEEEFLAWQRVFEVHGLPELRTTRIQSYRYPRSPRLVTKR